MLTGNEFHPLRNIFAFNRTVAEKVALAKQVEFNSDNSSLQRARSDTQR